MTFLRTAEFDENGEVQVLTDTKYELVAVDKKTEVGFKGQAKVKHETSGITREDLVPMDSKDAAEKYILSDELFSFISMPPMNHIDPSDRLMKVFNRTCTNIATKTERGRGNTVVYNPAIKDDIEDLIENFNEEVNFIETPKINIDRMFVFYAGKEDIDQPFYWVEGEGLLLNNKLNDVRGYGKFIRT